MKYKLIGKIVSTHGIKGEIRIISDFEYKELVFKKDVTIYIGKDYKKEIINSYRHHKNYEMITLCGYNNINDVLKFMNNNVYILKEEIEGLGKKILKSDIIGLDAYILDKKIGVIKDIYPTGINYEVIEIYNNNNKVLIPYHQDFIDTVDLENKKIVFKGGVIDA